MLGRKRYTKRGFSMIEFTEVYGKECSIQKSSWAEKDALWLGCNKGMHYKDDGKDGCSARMHVDRKLAKWLIKKLQKFVDTGDL